MACIQDLLSETTFDKFPIIDRRSYSEHLTQFLNSKSKGGYVLNLNAEWGAGKTTFLHCWYNELKKDHPVVYFDAWKSDFTHDAMLALLESFHSQLMNVLTEDKALIAKLVEGGGHFLKHSAWRLATGFIKRQGGMNPDDSLFSDVLGDLQELGLDPSELTNTLQETLSAMQEQRKKVESVQDFKNTLIDVSNAYLKVNDKSAPIYVLIDELDRCRPTYAIEVIESVKHFFNTDNFVFVLATDTEQLQHSIKAVYGEGFNSSNYLSRFFDRTATLPSPTTRAFIENRLIEIVGYFPEKHLYFDLLIAKIFEWHGVLSLREIEKVLRDVEVAVSTPHNFKIVVLIILSILKHRYPYHYNKWLNTGARPYGKHGNTSKELIYPAIRTENFPLTDHKEVSMLEIIYYISDTINFVNIDKNDYPKHRKRKPETDLLIKQYCRDMCGHYGTKEGKSFTYATNYFDTLNFAGLLTG